MSRRSSGIRSVALLVVVALAGCGGFFGGEAATQGSGPETLTPAPVPEETATPTPDPTPTPTTTPEATTVRTNETTGYAALEPTCERPPGLVVYIQVAALSRNDPETNDGIRTAWRFAAPSNKRFTGPYPNFEALVRSQYRPLLDAETVTLGPVNRVDTAGGRPVNRGDAVVGRNVTVTTETGTATTYRWRLTKQSSGRYDGCWMTTSVWEIAPSRGS